MSKLLKVHTEWLDSIGYSPYVWLRGDWHQPLHLLSKLLAVQLQERRPSNSGDDVAFKISFNTLAEETLGIPCLITERDLMIKYPNIMLAMLVYLICVKHAVDSIDPKSLRNVVAPKLVFEARNGGDAQFPRCASCHDHVFIIERVIVEATVWHRHCFKCVECNAPMRIGGFKKGKRGYECVSHAIRRILDAAEEVKPARPKFAPPAIPPLNCPTIEVTSSNEKKAPPPVSPKPKLNAGNKPKPSPPPKPARLSSSSEAKTAETRTQSALISHEYEDISICSENSGDSGIVVRTQNLSVDTDSDGYQLVSSTPTTPLLAAAVNEARTPVAPPRPKRASLLLSAGSTPRPSVTSSTSSCSGQLEQVPTAAPIPSTAPAEPDSISSSSGIALEDYPDDLCPFGENDEVDYDESKNPFADSDDESTSSVPVSMPRANSSVTPSSLLPGESDRPKCTPPPPPLAPFSLSADENKRKSVISEDKCRTLKISKKSIRAPVPPPTVCKRKIMFTNHEQLGDTTEIAKRLEALDDVLEKTVHEGKQLEVEMLFLITQNPSGWLKMPRTEEFIAVMCRFLDTLRESCFLQYMWREAFLNEIHSETEYRLRCIVEKESQDSDTLEREKQLTNLLIFIIDEKAKLSEENIEGLPPDSKAVKKQELKKRKLKLKLKLKLLSRKK
ncbi:LIM domain protein [Oesophagostomum dentatum]|uniref:LIM domain protein n=1 Tax=Oesophagostomum dentatum TaxID=61180 RepID=A0A0B1TNX1_OESDE|nr:LIM domain protein [Oesophagostomum dentatum]